MRSSFDAVLSHEFKEEGGYVDHPSDPGGATNMGITHKTLANWRKVSPWWKLDKSEVKNLARSEAAEIYRAKYWDLIRGDKLPAGVDLAVMDFAVNSGPARAAKALQRIVKAKVDGLIGPETLGLLAEYDEASVINTLCDDRMAFLQKLSTWSTFGKGWTARVKRTRKAALELVGAPAQPVEVTEEPSPAPEVPAAPSQPATGFQPNWLKIGIWAVGALALLWLIIRF